MISSQFFRSSLLRSAFLPRVAFRFEALNAARFVHDAFVEPRDRIAVERPAERFVHLAHVRDHRGLARRLVDRPAELCFKRPTV